MKDIMKQVGLSLILALFTFLSFGHTQQVPGVYHVGGKITHATSGVPLADVHIQIKGQNIGTFSDTAGNFIITTHETVFTLVFSSVGFQTQTQVVTSSTGYLVVKMEELIVQAEELVFSASRVEESIMKSPVSIGKMTLLEIQNTASDNAYRAIGNLKGVDIIQTSANNFSVNARGFNT